jgi:transposase
MAQRKCLSGVELDAGYRRLRRRSWGQAVKGEEVFADRAFQEGGPRLLRGNLTVESVAREVARKQGISLAQMSTRGQGRAGSMVRVLTAWVGREVAGISIARTAKHFGRDTSTMARNVSRLEERMRAEKAVAEKEELGQLRRENRQLKLEREILAKAAAWFARETGSVPEKSSGS